MIALLGLFVAGALAGAFGTVLVLVAVDARRYGIWPRPAMHGARRRIRAGLYRPVSRPHRKQLEQGGPQ